MKDAYQSLIPLMELKSSLTDVRHFHNKVNTIFHDYESRLYDDIHREMWASLPQQYQLTINDIQEFFKDRNTLKLLDIGCGTGLATQMLLDTAVNNKISEIHLIDTSAEMLKKAANRSKNWNKIVKTTHGKIDDLTEMYDIIIISSVLHHIPDLNGFFEQVNNIHVTGGLIITIHDPSADALDSTVYNKRCHELQQHRIQTDKTKKKLSLLRRAVNKIRRTLNPQDYIEKVNRELLKTNIINQPLTAPEIWSITDIHVESLPYSASNGISKNFLEKVLQNYKLISYRTYAFFGTLKSNLDPIYQQREQELIENKDMNGRNFSSIWIKE
jgi:SAM-dependent methyltransferase